MNCLKQRSQRHFALSLIYRENFLSSGPIEILRAILDKPFLMIEKIQRNYAFDKAAFSFSVIVAIAVSHMDIVSARESPPQTRPQHKHSKNQTFITGSLS